MKGLGLEGIYSQTIFYLFLCPFISFFQRAFLLPHNCGEGTPQLWGGFPTIVGKVHHSCGAITIKGLKTTFLLKRTTFKEEKTGVIFGGFCWKWGGRGDNFAKNIHRFAGVRRSRHARGANASWARGGRTTGAGRWISRRKKRLSALSGTTFKEKKNRSCFWVFLLEMGCAGG